MKHIVIALLLLAPQLEAQESPKSPWNVTEHVKLDDFIIQSHRGAGELAPENTMEAFELGWSLGTYPEADVRTTKDGVIVAFHDADFSRVVKGVTPEMAKKGVSDVTFEELTQLDVGAWAGDQFAGRRVSKISDILERMKGRLQRHLYLDIKQVDLKQLANEVKNAGVSAQVVLAAPKHETILQWKSYVPESDTLLWLSGSEQRKRDRIEALKKLNFQGVTQLQIHVRLPGDPSAKDIQPGEPFTPSRKFLIEVSLDLAKRGIVYQTLPYGGDDESLYTTLLDLGAASFSTDHPNVTKKAVAEYYKAKAAAR
ncbi:MAG TPA: glycerophosphodiester phosphodiesterase family protein [Pirellulales bacterium]|jgi:glycerophosphoryl diester phosphodiesterase|nr:glycerophosphodiester phosphodiesterase family protein [Pirellulales bacterium]